MRPLRLTMTAFGPYARTQVIDFTQLEDKNLFLVAGPTGSGKTTIFDAICYAIYGEASGAERDGENLRSHFADIDTLTQVELEFELRGIEYYVKRIPRQMKNKVRGEGLTEQSTDAELKIINEDISKTITGVKNVNKKLEEIMGISCDQFKQIVMIPQGEFRKLLTSDSLEKEKILQKIFRTQGYKLVENRLYEKAKTLRDKISLLENNRLNNINWIDTTGNKELKKLITVEDKNIQAILEGIQDQVGNDKEQEEKLSKKIDDQNKQLEKQQNKIFKTQENNRKFAEKNQIEKRKIELEEQKDEIEKQKVKLKKARKAAGLAGSEENYREKITVLRIRQNELKERLQELEQTHDKLQIAENVLTAEKNREDERNKLSEKQTILKGFREKVKNSEDKKIMVQNLEIDLKEKDEIRKACKKDIDKIKKHIKEVTEKLDRARTAREQYAEQKAKLEKIETIHNQFVRLDNENSILVKYRIQYIDISKKYNETKEKYTKAREHYEEIQELYFTGQIGYLAQKLEEGKPCPVCGASHHPAPAVLKDGMFTEEQINAAKDNLEQAEVKFKKNESNLFEIKSQATAKKDYIQSIKTELDVDDGIASLDREELTVYIKDKLKNLTEEKNKLGKQVHKLEREKELTEDLTEELKENNRAIEDKENELEKLNEEHIRINAIYEREKGSLENLINELPEDISTEGSLNKAIDKVKTEHEEMIKALKKAEELYNNRKINLEKARTTEEQAVKSKEEAQVSCQYSKRKFEKEMNEAGFNNEEEYIEARMDVFGIEKLDKYIGNYEQELRSITDSYLKAVKAVEGLELVDINQLNQIYSQMKENKDKLTTDMMVFHTRIEKNQEILEEIDRLSIEKKEKEKEYAIVGELAQVARGQNGLGLTFERYVLAAFLDSILEAANIRFKKMTGNRYQISRTDKRERSNAQSGLELEVFDQHTGMSRHVKTLSGGEGFKASLSLALGLADVVQSYAGGISLDTMFIDEGFGTLDSESLDNAIQVLVELQSSGRLVGVISHVPELKERINARLEVEPGIGGSTAEFK